MTQETKRALFVLIAILFILSAMWSVIFTFFLPKQMAREISAVIDMAAISVLPLVIGLAMEWKYFKGAFRIRHLFFVMLAASFIAAILFFFAVFAASMLKEEYRAALSASSFDKSFFLFPAVLFGRALYTGFFFIGGICCIRLFRRKSAL